MCVCVFPYTFTCAISYVTVMAQSIVIVIIYHNNVGLNYGYMSSCISNASYDHK